VNPRLARFERYKQSSDRGMDRVMWIQSCPEPTQGVGQMGWQFNIK
jgi:hypothetical protein